MLETWNYRKQREQFNLNTSTHHSYILSSTQQVDREEKKKKQLPASLCGRKDMDYPSKILFWVSSKKLALITCLEASTGPRLH